MLYFYRAEVIRVIDGDTIEVNIDIGFKLEFKNVMVRLVDCYAPETRTLDDNEKKRGLEVKALLTELLANNGNVVFINSFKTGSFKRWLGDLWLDVKRKESVNEKVRQWCALLEGE